MTTPIELVQGMIDEGSDAWQVICQLATSAEDDATTARWLVGDLALLVRKTYGKNKMQSFATAANLARSTVNQYKNMSEFYNPDVRYVYENLTYSHLRLARRLKDDAFEFLAEACYSSWTIEQAQVEVQKRVGGKIPPLKLLDAEACIQSINMRDGIMVLHLYPGWEDISLDQYIGQDVKVKLFELEGE